jgi:hypothetical protein
MVLTFSVLSIYYGAVGMAHCVEQVYNQVLAFAFLSAFQFFSAELLSGPRTLLLCNSLHDQ